MVSLSVPLAKGQHGIKGAKAARGGHGEWPRLAILAFICGAAAPGYILTVPHASERARTVAELIAVATILVAAAGIAMLLLVRGA
jgi:hypothetical protein